MTLPIKTEMHKGWIIDLDPNKQNAYAIYRRGPDGKLRSHKVVPGEDGPIMVAEPDLAFDPPAELNYVDAKGKPVTPDQKIAGVVSRNWGFRLSLSDLKRDGLHISVNSNGSLKIEGVAYWITTLLGKGGDYINYDAFCVQCDLVDSAPLLVRVLWIGDLDLF